MENKELFNDMLVKVDWLAFTTDYEKEYIIHLLGLNVTDFITMGHGSRGYKSGIKHNKYDISILFDGNIDMGTHIEITGKSIDGVFLAFMAVHSSDSPFGKCYNTPLNMSHLVYFLDTIRKISKNISRLDIAIDDCTCKYLSVGMVEKLINTACYVGKFRSAQTISKISLADGSSTGKTVYFGSRQSDLMIRVYDKALEQKIYDKYWVRWELELHNDYAVKAVKEMASNNSLSDIAFGLLSNYIRFIIHDKAKKTNCSTLQVWNDFLNNVKKASLYVKPTEKTIEDNQNWIDKQCGRIFAIVYNHDGGKFINDKMESWYLRAGIV